MSNLEAAQKIAELQFVSGNPGDFSVKEQGFIIADQYDDEIG